MKKMMSNVMVSLVIFILTGIGFADTGIVAPLATKTATPANINIAGSGINEETTVTLTFTGGGDEWSSVTPVNVVFALDSSGSMQTNDPGGLRKDVSESFIDRMDSSRDMAGVVSWDSGINFTQALTNDFALAKSRINDVNSSGGTNLNVGLKAAIEVLNTGKQADATGVIIFLTDGGGTYTYSGNSGSPTDEAAAKGYLVYSVGLGNPATAPLIDMATVTGGNYYLSPTANDLHAIFDDIFAEIITSTIPHYVDIEEVTQSHIIDEGSFNVTPDSVDTVNGITTIRWNNIGIYADGDPDFSGDETVALTFTAKSNQYGQNLEVDVLGVAKVHYSDKDGNYIGSVDIPQAYINVNAPPDVSGAYPSQYCLWPPNHKFTNVTIEGVTDPDGDEVFIEIIGITSDEPTDSIEGAGGKHAPDADGIGTSIAKLRVELSGTGNGRVYEIRFVARDGKGGESEGSVFANVPHDQSGECESFDDGQFYDATELN